MNQYLSDVSSQALIKPVHEVMADRSRILEVPVPQEIGRYDSRAANKIRFLTGEAEFP